MLQKIDIRLEKVETKLETLTILEQKVDKFDSDLNKLRLSVYDSNKKFDEKFATIDDKMEHLEFNDAKMESELTALTAQTLK